MAVLAPIPQILGTAFAGCKWFAYLADTTTKTTIYATNDDAGATLSNPTVLDANGGTTTGIWMKVNQNLKFMLYPATEVNDPPTGTPLTTLNNVSAPGLLAGTAPKTANYLLTLADNGKIILCDATAGNITITAPAAATLGTGFRFGIKKIAADVSANTITFDPNSSEKVDNLTTWTISKPGVATIFVCDGTGWHIETRVRIIYDENGNELLITETTPSAVNEMTLINAAAGNGPILQATGDEANIETAIRGKGTGSVRVGCSSGGIPLKLEPAGSSNTVSFSWPSINAARTLTYPNYNLDYRHAFFAAHNVGTGQTIATTTLTKLSLTTELADVAGYFDNATNYRFTPLVAGTYVFIGYVAVDSFAADGQIILAQIYKNGTTDVLGNSRIATGNSTSTTYYLQVFTVITMNGTTDYVELYITHSAGGNRTCSGALMGWKIN